MSYNCTDSEYISGKLYINIADRYHLALNNRELPEISFLHTWMEEHCIGTTDDPAILEIKKFSWYGDGSGYCMDYLTDTILPKTTGEAEIMFIWEGGDSITGLHVKDGVVTKKNVKHHLVD